MLVRQFSLIIFNGLLERIGRHRILDATSLLGDLMARSLALTFSYLATMGFLFAA